MKWNLEELSENAMVSYLIGKIPGTIRVSAAWDRDEMQYPCAVVHADSSGPVSDLAEWHDARTITLFISVMTEAAHELDEKGVIVRTARERNADARSAVIDALASLDLLDGLIQQGVDGIAFSQAQFTTCARSQDGKYLVSMLAVELIVEPVEGT